MYWKNDNMKVSMSGEYRRKDRSDRSSKIARRVSGRMTWKQVNFQGKNGREAGTLSGASVEGYYIEAQMTEIARRVNGRHVLRTLSGE